MGRFKQVMVDCSLSAIQAGLITVIICFASMSVLIFQAAHAAHFSAAFTSSWLGAVAFGSGLISLILSLCYRAPVIAAWSTPGAALLVAMLPGYSPGEAVAAYIAAALIIAVIGLTGIFDALSRRLPGAIAAAMLAGILFPFGTSLFTSVAAAPLLVLAMLVVFLIMRRLKPRYAVLAVLVFGLLLLWVQGQLHLPDQAFVLTVPMWVSPQWSWHAVLNLGIPLALVALTGQFIPGMAVLRASGYRLPSRQVVGGHMLASLLLAPFGSHGLNLAALVAAICTGPEAHPDSSRRYIAGVACGIFFLLAGLAAGTVALLLAAVPKAWVAALAGVALFDAIGSNLFNAMHNENQRAAALITFLLTASGMHFLGIGSAFWGIVIGMLAYGIQNLGWRR